MKKVFLIILVIICLLPKDLLAQGADCATASPFCTAVPASFPAQTNTTAPAGPNYGCLGSEPNPAWFYLQISTAGTVTLNLSDAASVDIDFTCWGPFTTPAAGCASGLTNAPVSCSYSSSATETCVITNAIVGQVYILLITNYSNQPTTISLVQDPNSGIGATNCNIVCAMSAVTAVPGPCTSPSNIYDVSGTITYTAPPTTGTLTITNSCSSATKIIYPPFNATSAAYTLTGLPSNGATCTVTAKFSADPTCMLTQTFTAPAPCFVNCPIHVDSARVCAGLPATLTASGATHYLWSNNDTAASITVSGVAASYTVIGTTGTCKDTVVSVVTTFPPPTVSFTADKLNGCDTLTVKFKADTIGNSGAIYAWNLGENATGDGIQTSHLYTSYGCHTVSLTASFGPGCSTTHSDSCMITVFPPPSASFIVTPNEIDILAPTAGFVNTSTSSTNWLWNFGDTTSSSSTLQNPDHTYHAIGTYNVTLYASSFQGCKDSAKSSVVIKDVITCYIPNTFTPNKNEHNDIFNIYSYGISSDNFELLIFNRWGKQIFKTNDLNEGWNGAINNAGDVVETAIYVYHLNYQESNGKKHTLMGLVSLVK